jgi:hypothetical protein
MIARGLFVYPAVVAMLPALATCVDATHDQQVQALGGEVNGVPPGPDHRPGQPCLVCHGGQGPASGQLSVAGTAYAVYQQSTPAVGASVQIEDITGAVFTLRTNEVGNFYIPVQDWQPTYPLGQIQVSLGPASEQMTTHVGRDGSCCSCHQSQAGPTSPGSIYVAVDQGALVPEGGTGEAEGGASVAEGGASEAGP